MRQMIFDYAQVLAGEMLIYECGGLVHREMRAGFVRFVKHLGSHAEKCRVTTSGRFDLHSADLTCAEVVGH